jgi:hypothetical protein
MVLGPLPIRLMRNFHLHCRILLSELVWPLSSQIRIGQWWISAGMEIRTQALARFSQIIHVY